MKTTHLKDSYCFPAVFYFDRDGIAVEFPDLPGCLSCEKSKEEALRNAKNALGLYLCDMEIDGDAIPAPTSVRNLHPDDGGVTYMIQVFMPPIREKIKREVAKNTAWKTFLEGLDGFTDDFFREGREQGPPQERESL